MTLKIITLSECNALPHIWSLFIAHKESNAAARSRCRFSRVVDDLKAVAFLERQVVRRASLVVVQGHEEGDAA